MSMMITILALAIILAVAAIVYFTRYRSFPEKLLLRIPASCRKIYPDEKQAVIKYLSTLRTAEPSFFSRLTRQKTSKDPVFTLQSHKVYSVTHPITRYGLSTESPRQWRYYLDTLEIHLPPLWEQFITAENTIELIPAGNTLLVTSLNGHQLIDYDKEVTERPLPPPEQVNSPASIRKEKSSNVELLQIRKETPEEHQLSRPDGTTEAVIICLALLILFLSQLVPTVVMLWLVIPALLIIAGCLWLMYRPVKLSDYQDIHCMRGIPKRWGLFGESNQEQSNISLGVIDLQYPDYWKPYIHHDLGKVTDIDINAEKLVVRQGRFLSLHDEIREYPLRHWRRNAVLASGALLVLIMMASWVPLGMPFKLSLAWLQGTQRIEVTSLSQLSAMKLRVGDLLDVKGQGMCSVPGSYQGNRMYGYMPFDCSAIYWNNATPLPLPQSETVDETMALLETIRRQLHPGSAENMKINPQLALAIEKSGMILLDDFSDIVIRANQLCGQPMDCTRLKNALVNLENAKDWPSLVDKAKSGQLNGINVLLRPVSADTLESLVNNAAATFFTSETRKAIETLNSPPPGGYLLISDQGRQFVRQPQPDVPLFNLDAPQQWDELQRISAMLLHTPFSASGIITALAVDANGTTHVSLHEVPGKFLLWRYLGTSLFLIALIACLLVNVIFLLRGIHKDRQRSLAIQRYYDKCFNPTLSHPADTRSLF
ncbi:MULTISPECIES: IgaA/UmoB family intracellular growth attenuator [Tatumella]|uniref:IgaA/UmoB family intracellular growth attenuator n=1 Tax=Tatumella punctata TaxID=399969 RepID=A0ABW1VKV0_9GAMM|nr:MULTISPECIES: IgaA/UmoB family intracellular growth attenuator [unclassified Tatumella]MBS0855693.1 intracellular growth attenuator family protein [Tatumella sp. JGM16]MBS0876674.1 intracellular growth attenuator family protein [Tatumella sp. JGM82]MBS0889939.1 intracellular growth attenuator family protein [Tatumella sp. JGM94]MBS0893199.1 intracellular growth attenuator family protein [Tatumella sp. JGM130]MBS0901183.1 intracellular growth attenuator family protein [Tatumella sp. JGM100]